MGTTQHEPFDPVNSLDEANAVAYNGDMVLRIQPPAPGATQYFWFDGEAWQFQKCGHSTARTVSAELVRERVKKAIPKNDRAGGGGVRAVEKERVGRYA